jgi:hypothetical protein
MYLHSRALLVVVLSLDCQGERQEDEMRVVYVKTNEVTSRRIEGQMRQVERREVRKARKVGMAAAAKEGKS